MNKKQIFLITILATIISSFFLLEISGRKLNNKLYKYVNAESKRLVSNIVNYSINETLEDNLNDDLFTITKNKQNEVEILDYNTKEVNRILKVINKSIYDNLLKLEEGHIEDFAIAETFKKGKFKNVKTGVICEIPLGSLKNNAFFSNFGPNIPIRMTFLGTVKSNINTKITSYGFNSLVVETTIHIEIEERITMPTSSKINTIKIDAPLTLKVIQGIIPEYYYIKGLEKSSAQQYYNEDN